MRVSAKVDYGLRAMTELAASPAGTWVKGEAIATAQSMSVNFCENILRELRRAGFVEAHRGADGGYRLARPAAEIYLAQIIRVLEGPLAAVQGLRPEELEFTGSAAPLQHVWIAVRSRLRSVLDVVTLADVAGNDLPADVRLLAADPENWTAR